MRVSRSIAVAALAAALVVSMTSPAFARSHRRGHRAPAPFQVSAPALGSNRVTTGVAFDATGVVLPAFAVDDTSTLSIEVYGPGDRGGRTPIQTVAAALSASPDTGTVYAATITLADPGEYRLVAVVTSGGSVVARSRGTELRVVLPYRVSKPSILDSHVATGTAFEATGDITPGIAVDDVTSNVAVLVYSMGRHGDMTQVGTFTASVTGDVATGSVYDASVSIDAPGRYVLVAVMTQADVVVGRSGGRVVVVGAPGERAHGGHGNGNGNGNGNGHGNGNGNGRGMHGGRD